MMAREPSDISALIERISVTVSSTPGWTVLKRTSRLIQAAPRQVIEALPAIGAGGIDPRGWFTLDFWVQGLQGGLGLFWRSNPVADRALRNRVLESLLAESAKTGIEYFGSKDWREVSEPAFSGETVSAAWWPKEGEPSLPAAEAVVVQRLAEWEERLPAMVSALRSVRGGARAPSRDTPTHAGEQVRPTTVVRPTPVSSQPRTQRAGTGRSTPPIPEEFKKFRAQPAYTSIFEIYPDETRIYGTEDLYGDWNAEVVLMAKDAGNVRNFLATEQGGLGWSWVHNPSRPTNRNLIPLAEQLPGPKLYASFLGPLLRNDGGESGPLVMSEQIRSFVRSLFEWTIASMPRVKTVAVLGQEGWKELVAAVGLAEESRRWKARHLSGEPLVVSVSGKKINMVALNHPARIPAALLMQQRGWGWILERHAKDGIARKTHGPRR